LGIFTISGLCLLRGAATLPLSFMFPDNRLCLHTLRDLYGLYPARCVWPDIYW